MLPSFCNRYSVSLIGLRTWHRGTALNATAMFGVPSKTPFDVGQGSQPVSVFATNLDLTFFFKFNAFQSDSFLSVRKSHLPFDWMTEKIGKRATIPKLLSCQSIAACWLACLIDDCDVDRQRTMSNHRTRGDDWQQTNRRTNSRDPIAFISHASPINQSINHSTTELSTTKA